jgi:hypothetical protein
MNSFQKSKMNVEPSDMHVGIFGVGRGGKTTLAKNISREVWATAGIRSLVWDINGEQWGRQAMMFMHEEPFWRQVWREKSCMIFVDEAAETIKRDSDKTSLFTRVRHRGHKLVVIGHTGASLLPAQRNQISTLYLFRQSPEGADLWAQLYADRRIMASTALKRYEFLECHLFGDPRKRILKL